MIYIDIETRSDVSLKKDGAYKYVQSPKFSILCAVLYDSITKKTTSFFNFASATSVPSTKRSRAKSMWVLCEVLHDIGKENATLTAHNVAFERTCLQTFFNKKYTGIKWACTMSKCFSVSLPAALSAASEFFDFDRGKLSTGAELIKKYSIPNSNGTFNTFTEKDSNAMLEYCEQDTLLCAKLDAAIPNSQDKSQYLMQTLEINDIGIPVNTELAQKVVDTLAESAKTEEDKNEINVRSSTQILGFCASRGVILENTRAKTVEDVLSGWHDLPMDVRSVLRSRQLLSRSSTSKFRKILATAINGRLLGGFQYYGAHTGRDAGRGVQPQNLPRGNQLDIDLLPYIDNQIVLDSYNKTAVEVAKGGLRSIIRSDSMFFCSDFSNIETRIALWLAGDPNLKLLQDGTDLYIKLASDIFGCGYDEVTKEQREIGKGAVLGLGFGMGDGISYTSKKDREEGNLRGFKAYVSLKNIQVSDDIIIKAVETYRYNFPYVVKAWSDFYLSFINALQKKERIKTNGCVFKQINPLFFGITLPSRRKILYFRPEIVDSPDRQSLIYYSARPPVKQEVREKTLKRVNGSSLYQINLYGGKIFQNIVQSIARDILFEACDRLLSKGYRLIGRFHDEILAERSNDKQSLSEFNRIMSESVAWAPGLELKVEGWTGNFYRK